MSRIYPEIEVMRRLSDTYEKMPHNHQNRLSNLEKNCSEIFTKGPALTREMLEKMQKGNIGPHTTRIFGYKFNTRHFWVMAGLLLLFLLSSTGLVIMWFTNTFDNAVFSKLVLTKGSTGYEIWENPSPKPLIKMYMFNYTNWDDFDYYSGRKLNVKELGPYVYEISLKRLNIRFNGSTVSYQENRQYTFMPELSNGCKQNDRIVVPNLPMLSAAAVHRHSNLLTRFGVSSILNGLEAKAFLSLPVHRFLVGYDDNLYKITKSVLKFQNHKPLERIGLFTSKLGVSDDVITINTGAKDINRVGTIEKYNGVNKLDYWTTSECNSFKGASDGSIYSPKKIRNKQPVSFYIREMCRALPMYFEKEVRILNGKIPAYRYALPYSVFDHPDRSPANQCFCNLDSGECPPQGVFNATPCTYDAPFFISFPHFHNGDPRLTERITGLNPNQSLHKTYVDLHPTLGFMMATKIRLQVNVQVKKSFGFSQLNHFEDGLYLPIAWLELSLEDKTLPDDMVGLIFQTTFTVKTVETGLRYGFLLMTSTTLIFMLLILRNKLRSEHETDSARQLPVHHRSSDSNQ